MRPLPYGFPLLLVDGLDAVFAGTEFERLPGGFQGRISRQHDDLDPRVVLLHFREHLDPRHLLQLDVEDGQVRRALGRVPDGLLLFGEGRDLMPLTLENPLHQNTRVGHIVQNNYRRHHHSLRSVYPAWHQCLTAVG